MKCRIEILEEYAKAASLFAELGIPLGAADSVSYNGRLTKRWGYCRRLSNGHFAISVSSVLAASSLEALRSVLYHEMLHTCPECFNHGKRWRSYAKIVTKATGVEIERTSDASALGVREPYYIKCRKCEVKVRYPMRPRNTEGRRCPVCGSRKLSCFRKENGTKIREWKR